MARHSTARSAAPAATPADSAPVRAPSLWPADLSGAEDAAYGGARQLQDDLRARLADGDLATPDARWSPRRMLAFAVGASALLWGGIVAGGYLLLNA